MVRSPREGSAPGGSDRPSVPSWGRRKPLLRPWDAPGWLTPTPRCFRGTRLRSLPLGCSSQRCCLFLMLDLSCSLYDY